MANEQNLRPFNSQTGAKNGAKGGAAKKGSKHINTWVQEILQDPEFEALVSDGKDGTKQFKGAPLKAIIKAQAIKAVNGDTKAYDSLVKSGWAARTETDLHVKELPKPLLDGLSSNDLNKEDTQTSQTD